MVVLSVKMVYCLVLPSNSPFNFRLSFVNRINEFVITLQLKGCLHFNFVFLTEYIGAFYLINFRKRKKKLNN